MREKQRLDEFSALLLTALLVGIFSIGSAANAVDVTQPPSAFEIITDGVFTTPQEWSDVTPSVRLGGDSLVYTSTDPGLDALYLMYDLPSSTTPLPGGATAGPVHFHNSGASFEVFFTCPGGILVLKDGTLFDVSDPRGGEDSIEGACGFGPSPQSAVPHNMFELEVLFDGSDPTLAGHSHGQYSPDPSHWGAGLPTDPGQTQDPTCTLPSDPNCNAANDPQGGGFPTSVPCPPGGPGQDPDIRFSFGEEVSNACVNVVRGSGGTTLVTEIPFPELSIPTLSQWGLILFGMLLLTAMFVTIRRRGLPTQMTASLLVLMSAGLIAVSVSYTEIQSSRGCGENDVAEEFVNDLLNG